MLGAASWAALIDNSGSDRISRVGAAVAGPMLLGMGERKVTQLGWFVVPAVLALVVVEACSDEPASAGGSEDASASDVGAGSDADHDASADAGSDSALPDVVAPDDVAADVDATSPPDASDADAGAFDASDGATADASDGGVDAADAGPFHPIGSGVPGIVELLVAGGYVYFVTEAYDLGWVPVAGGPVSTFSQSGVLTNHIAVDDTNLYWSSLGGEAYKRPHGAANTAVKLAATGTLSGATALASDGTYLYWTASDVRKLAIGGGVTDAGTVLTKSVYSPEGVTIAAGGVYVTEHGPTNVGQVDQVLGDGGIKVVTSSLYNSPPTRLITDQTRLYWSEGVSSPWSIEGSLLGGTSMKRYASSAQRPSIATDGTSFYYMSGATNSATVVKGPVDLGSSMTTLYPNLGYTAYTLAVDGSYLYWADYTNGVIYRAPK